MGHWRWLAEDRPFRYDKDGFDGNMEFGSTPTSIISSQVLTQLEGTMFTYGKSQTNIDVDERDEEQIWKKRSIFFDL